MAKLTTQILLRRDTAENLETISPVLQLGEPAYATDTKKFVIGDGASKFSELTAINADVSNATVTIKQSGLADQVFTLNGPAKTITLKDDNTTYDAGDGLTRSIDNKFSVNTNGIEDSVSKIYPIVLDSKKNLVVKVPWESSSLTDKYLPLIGGTMSGNILVDNVESTIGDSSHIWKAVHTQAIEAEGTLHINSVESQGDVVIHNGQAVFTDNGALHIAGNFIVGSKEDKYKDHQSIIQMYRHAHNTSPATNTVSIIPLWGTHDTAHYLPDDTGVLVQNHDLVNPIKFTTHILNNILTIDFSNVYLDDVVLDLQLWDYGSGRALYPDSVDSSAYTKAQGRSWKTIIINQPYSGGIDSGLVPIVNKLRQTHTIDLYELLPIIMPGGFPKRWDDFFYMYNSGNYTTTTLDGNAVTIEDLTGHQQTNGNIPYLRVRITQKGKYTKHVYYTQTFKIDYNHSLDGGERLIYKENFNFIPVF